MKKPARLNALTGLRCFRGYQHCSLSFFQSTMVWPARAGGERRVRFGELFHPALGLCAGVQLQRQTRAGELNNEPVLRGALHAALSDLPAEPDTGLSHGAAGMGRTHARDVLERAWCCRRCLLQGWIPEIATFLNTPAWTMSAESFYYVLFPWMSRWKKPERLGPHLAKMGRCGCSGWFRARLYVIFNPGRPCASGSLELWQVAAGAEIYAAAASGELCIWRDAGESG